MLRCLNVALLLVFLADVSIADDAKLRFNRDIRAILSDKCFACHGPDADTVEADLRLDLRDAAIDSGAMVPGDAKESELVRRILSDDSEEIMPPPESHKPLTDAEKKLLSRWIDEGAEYESHWAYTPMRQTELLKPHEGDVAAVIDAAVDARLKRESQSPAETADRVTLIRRLSFDLTGMPPTSGEVDAFVHDESDNAYEKLVDRLLDSPRYGERMAVYWLDLVRYADTVGYHGDQNVSQSPYRDYVIGAFNANMPYDQFVREQLAGDLLPDATLWQRVASGYNRLNQTTEEGGSQAKEYLAIYFADRVRNVSQVFMGATVGCAQCHDHKYDPYTSKDFYSLGAFFADIDERGVYGARARPPTIRVPTPELQHELDVLDKHIVELKSRRSPLTGELIELQPQWETEARKKLSEVSEVTNVWVDDKQDTGGKSNGDWRFVDAEKGPVHSGKLSRRQESAGLTQHFFENATSKVTVGADTQFYAWVHLDPKNPPKAIMVQLNDGKWDHRYVWGGDEIDFGRKKKSWAGYHRAGKLPAPGQWTRLEIDPKEIGLTIGSEISGMAFTQFGGLTHWDAAGWVDTKSYPQSVADALNLDSDKRTETQTKTLREFYVAQTEQMIGLNAQIDDAQAERKRVEETAPMTVVSQAVAPRTIRILPRGNWMDDSGEIVEPAIPEFLGKLNVSESGKAGPDADKRRATRLDLANWLCENDNPLTARTMVNRLWSLMFGRGICSSVDDFGGQGTYPSYPDLLDALSIQFAESGWDVKQMIRGIVTSETYRRGSRPTPDQLAKDPYNDWFARQGRFCIDAEMVRDAALATSGLLVESVGGASVRPYQPSGYYAQLNFPKRKYASDANDNQYRRGVYTHWQRTFLHPMLKAFDAPSREECTAARARSNTPLQALVLLNDPTFVEAARVFAARIMREGGETPVERIRWAYETAVSRAPTPSIENELSKIHSEHLTQYRDEIDSAKQLVSEGNSATADDLDAAELAAWTSVARVILNLHETITRY